MSQKYDEYLEKHRQAVKKLINGLCISTETPIIGSIGS